MFVGDSLSLNQWQSLTCMLHTAAPEATYNLARTRDISTFTFMVIIILCSSQLSTFLPLSFSRLGFNLVSVHAKKKKKNA